jgi:dihydroorotate dehydrogenase (NAD+) catalytic subunit
MIDPQNLPRYDRHRSYQWNYDQAPDVVEVDVPAVPGTWTFCGLPVDSPLGIPAGPLLNGRWIRYYAALGFDVLTYKTVRSTVRECYPLPNLQPVATGQLTGEESLLKTSEPMQGSWAVSFGMPSKSPEHWRADIEQTRKNLPAGKVLSVSVVGSVQPGWTIDDLADDYAQCARWAIDSGADCIETNFSCPNVSTCDGQLYQQPESAAQIAARVREAIGRVPYILKIGHVLGEERAAALLDAVAPFINGLAMTNSVAAHVSGDDGALLFDGQRRGICGDATRNASVAQTRLFARLIGERNLSIRLIGVGGASSAEHVLEYLQAGAESVHIATAAMVDPLVGCRIREALAKPNGLRVDLVEG